MTESDSAHNPGPQERQSCLRQFAEWYKRKPIADFLIAIQPAGLLVTAFAFVVAIIALTVTFYELKQSRTVNEATLLVLAMERIEAARKLDSPRDKEDRPKRAVSKDDNEVNCSSKSKQFSARAGQIPILERMARLGISLRDLVLRDVNLVVTRKRRDKENEELRGIDLSGADLSYADLSNTNLRDARLSNANLSGAQLDGSCLKDALLMDSHLYRADIETSDLDGADLSNANLSDADLYQVNFIGATLSGAILTNANITGANFKRVKGLTQDQLNGACAESDEPPRNLPKVDRKRLEWRPKQCP